MPIAVLSTADQAAARAKAVQAAYLAYRNKAAVHYTQGPSRWQGIATGRIAATGAYPNYADCSAFATWCLWNALCVPYGMSDVVNGADWKAGYTGTMLGHGTAIHAAGMQAGDCVIYGTGFPGHHTAICVGVAGVPMVISHGSEAGPFYLPYNYRGDVMSIRRYIDGEPHLMARPPGPTPPKEDEIVAIATGMSSSGALHVFYEAKDGSVWYTWQAKGENNWAGGQPGKSVAGLKPFAPAPK